MTNVALPKHELEQVPVYQLFVYARPSSSGKGRQAYVSALQVEARRQNVTPIDMPDVEIAMIYSTKRPASIRADVDNILKPTLDGLKGIAYVDDRVVRAVSARIFDRSGPFLIWLDSVDAVGLLNSINHPDHDDVIIVYLYSPSRTEEMGGREAVRARLRQEALDETRSVYERT
jgi:Holliday junction resolvase RusA-like endonuclease